MLAHELVHAGDICASRSYRPGGKTRTFGDGPGQFGNCDDWICSEARAIAMGCCDFRLNGASSWQACFDKKWNYCLRIWSRDCPDSDPVQIRATCGLDASICTKELPIWP